MIKDLFVFLIKIYRKYISPLKYAPTCRFVPTCSQYAMDAFEEWGALIGLILSVWRILRCNPFCRGGFDPVPKRTKKNKNNQK